MVNEKMANTKALAAKEAVLKFAVGLRSLPEMEFLLKLEELYWMGFAAGEADRAPGASEVSPSIPRSEEKKSD